MISPIRMRGQVIPLLPHRRLRRRQADITKFMFRAGVGAFLSTRRPHGEGLDLECRSRQYYRLRGSVDFWVECRPRASWL